LCAPRCHYHQIESRATRNDAVRWRILLPNRARDAGEEFCRGSSKSKTRTLEYPEARGGDLGQSVEAGQACPEHDQSSFDGTPWLESAISQGRQQRRGEAEDLFAVADQAAENG
jgi:hypothetical protein